jgi:prepilin-type processing-associated H-X9-DG protein
MVGEKHIPLHNFGVGWWDCSSYNGDYFSCYSRSGGVDNPLVQDLDDQGWKFGSYHPGLCQFVMCDGSVRVLKNTLDPRILGLLADKADGQVIPDYDE